MCFGLLPQGKNKVLIEFHMDDTGSAAEKDTLVDISFFVPSTSQVYEAVKETGEEKTAAQVRILYTSILCAYDLRVTSR